MKNSSLGKRLGQRIRELRIAKQLKQGEFADLLEMERTNLTRIENGLQRPNDENLIKIAKILDVQIKDLFDFEHLVSRENLISLIHKNLKDLNDSEIQYIYKSIRNLKNIKY